MQIPTATYRLQFQPGFGFAEAADIVPYLSALGISHIYASPIFRPRKGSGHGYDCVDPNTLNPELGSKEDWQRLIDRLREYKMGWIQDIVPNHMAFTAANRMLADILKNGSSSRFGDFFDIDWNHPSDKLRGKVMAPFLGQSYEECLENGDIRIVRDEDGFAAAYGDLKFPLSAESRPELPDGLDEAERRQRLDALLSRQHFRLCCWKDANKIINYRRFFDINELIALRQEDLAVFEETHRRLFELAAENIVSGVRIDHVDGLADPAGYLQRLRERLTDGAYIVVEKILAPEEPLPSDWPVAGTTGYDFSHWLNAVFVCRDNEERFTSVYTHFTGQNRSFEAVVTAAKKEILLTRMAGELDNLVRRIEKIPADQSKDGKDAGEPASDTLKEALFEVLARFPVYRTYIEGEEIRPADRAVVDTALGRAARSRPDLEKAFGLIRGLLLECGRSVAPAAEDGRRQCIRAVRSFQQLSSALMAKGFEDTAFYRYHRLVSLNEVGSEPGRFGCSTAAFHDAVARRALHWPHAMNGTATHDSKRGEDVRARLDVLSEIPTEWESRLEAWHASNRDHRSKTYGGDTAPERNTEYLLYQTLVGAWPEDGVATEAFVGRIKAYMIKAVREAGEHTSWIAPQAPYESAVTGFVDKILRASPENEFLSSLALFCKKIAAFGIYNSLSQSLVKMTVPGVPDFYQGTELPQFTLVDPDNRSPVAYDERQRLLKATATASDPMAHATELMSGRLDAGRLKIFVTARALDLRREFKDLFETGGYLPLETGGRFRRKIIAFARTSGRHWCVVAVPRFLTGLVTEGRNPLGRDVWFDTAVLLPATAPRSWRHVLTGQWIEGDAKIAAGDVMQYFPLGLLIGEEAS